MNRDMLGRRLQRQGYRVTMAVDGRQALEFIKQEPFDLVLLDKMLPVMNGYEVLEHLKADQSLSHIPVIITTALDESDDKAKCMELGAEDYLTKPFNPVILKSRISDCLERHHRAESG
jgi:DNA-binding response OmpR family regulator